MIPARVVERKRDGESIPPSELTRFLGGYLNGAVSDAQLSAFLMAAFFNGMNEAETDALVDAMLASGATLDWPGLARPCVDKHSTGGVGDKVSLALAPLVAALGIAVPMMSGRGLGHTAGTLDKLHAIPGFRTDISLVEFRRLVEEIGCAMIGQTNEIAPLDGRIYALRDVTGTVPIVPVIASSIMSKKLAEGLDGLLLDVKVGDGAFIPEEESAIELAQHMVRIGQDRGLPTRALLTAMDRPLGVAIGNGLEMAEAIECLRGGGPPDLRALVVREAAEMLALADASAPSDDYEIARFARMAEAALDDGRALDRFAGMVEAQGGDPTVVERPDILVTAPHRRSVLAEGAGSVTEVAPRVLGHGVVALGGGRRRAEDDIDLGVGFEVHVRPGQEVSTGDPLGTIHASDEDSLEFGEFVLREAIGLTGDFPSVRTPAPGEAMSEDSTPSALRPLVSHIVDHAGVRSLNG